MRNIWMQRGKGCGKEWFTPEQFLELFKDNRYQEFEDYPVVYDPWKAVEEGKIAIQAMQDRLNAFVDRINKYYGNKK